jgi:hypothetical protein
VRCRLHREEAVDRLRRKLLGNNLEHRLDWQRKEFTQMNNCQKQQESDVYADAISRGTVDGVECLHDQRTGGIPEEA